MKIGDAVTMSGNSNNKNPRVGYIIEIREAEGTVKPAELMYIVEWTDDGNISMHKRRYLKISKHEDGGFKAMTNADRQRKFREQHCKDALMELMEVNDLTDKMSAVNIDAANYKVHTMLYVYLTCLFYCWCFFLAECN
jgi:hypothetical protein